MVEAEHALSDAIMREVYALNDIIEIDLEGIENFEVRDLDVRDCKALLRLRDYVSYLIEKRKGRAQEL